MKAQNKLKNTLLKKLGTYLVITAATLGLPALIESTGISKYLARQDLALVNRTYEKYEYPGKVSESSPRIGIDFLAALTGFTAASYGCGIARRNTKHGERK